MSLSTLNDFAALTNGVFQNDANVKEKEMAQLQVEVVNQVAWLKADNTGDAVNLLV
jgi:hypothetical protein